MDSVRPKLSEVAGENDDTTQLEDEKRRHIPVSDQDGLLSAEEEELFWLNKLDEPDVFYNCSTIYSKTRHAEHPQVNCPGCNSQNSNLGYFIDYEGQTCNFCKTCRRYWTEDDTLRNILSFSATSFASNRSSAASTSKNERENSNNRGKTAETSPLKDPSTEGYDCKEWHLHNQTGRKYRDVGPNSVTGSGFWGPSGTNNPTHYSNATPSGPNYTSIFASMDNQPQLSEPPSNQHPARPEVRIYISDGNTELSKEYIDQLKNSLCDDDAMKIMSGTLTAVAGQVIDGVMVHKITNSAAASYEWHLHNQTGRKYWDVGPNIVTGSGFWELSGTNNPTYYSNATPSGPNYTSIFGFLDNQPQPSEPPSNQHPARPEVSIDIGNTELSILQSWKEYKDHRKNSQSDDDAIKIMSGTLTAVAGQVIGGVMVHKITSSTAAPYSWAGPTVEIATVLGLCVTLAGISLRGRSRAQSALMIKIGAVITASAIVFSMGLHLPPAMALTVGPVMFLIMAVAAAFA